MDENHREVAETIFSSASMTLTERGAVAPVILLILETEQVLPIVIQGEVYGLYEYSMIANDIAKQMEATAMILVAEQWMVKKKQTDVDLQPLLNGIIRPSEHPDKEEYLTLMYSDGDGTCESLIAKIHKDPSGRKFTRDQNWISEAISNVIQPWK